MLSKSKIFSIVIGAIGLPALTAATEADVSWHLANKLLSDQAQSVGEAGESLLLGDEAQHVTLKEGWSCVISPTSKQLPAYEARQITCENDGKSFAFSVQCEKSRPTDHAQIRFMDSRSRPVDFIEVRCKLSH